jgi:uncharacterized SAM-binding protein YcdF (DUF218 family)
MRSRQTADGSLRPADAVVVLGCRVDRGGKASAALNRRVDCGIRLFHEGAAPLLVLSGGGAGPISEAEVMRRAALARGVPEIALLTEPTSRNTFENANETARLLGSRGLRSVLLVSHRAHLPRARLLFRLAGLRVIGCAAASPTTRLWGACAAVHEFAALPVSLLRSIFHTRETRTPE